MQINHSWYLFISHHALLIGRSALTTEELKEEILHEIELYHGGAGSAGGPNAKQARTDLEQQMRRLGAESN